MSDSPVTGPFDETIPAINEDTIDHNCFGCGDLNRNGLRLRFRPLPDGGVWASFTPAASHEGYMGMAHGGILSTVLDEAMSWAVTYHGDLGVTARLSLTFRMPARLNTDLRALAWVTARRARTIDTRAELRDADTGSLVAEAEGRFVRVSREQAGRWRDAYGTGIEGSVFGDAASRNAGETSGCT